MACGVACGVWGACGVWRVGCVWAETSATCSPAHDGHGPLNAPRATRTQLFGKFPSPRNTSQYLTSTQSDCWRDEAGTRPSFAAILDILKAFEAEGGEIERPLDATKILKLTHAANAGCQCVVC